MINMNRYKQTINLSSANPFLMFVSDCRIECVSQPAALILLNNGFQCNQQHIEQNYSSDALAVTWYHSPNSLAQMEEALAGNYMM